MTTQEILTTLQADIHSTVFATLDTHGLPQTCVIDLMQMCIRDRRISGGRG